LIVYHTPELNLLFVQVGTSGAAEGDEEAPGALEETLDEEGVAAEADDLEEEPDLGRRVWLLESCLAWGGEQRLRLRLTIASFPGEHLSLPFLQL
jgi:hypothetical protein